MKRVILSVVAGLFVLTACVDKDEVVVETSGSDAVEALQEYSVAMKLFNDAGSTSDDGVDDAESSSEETSTQKRMNEQSNEAVVTVSPADFTTFPKTINVDFGDGVTGLDGVVRKGEVNIVSTAWRNVLGSVHIMTFDNYYQNDYQLKGTRVATNLSSDSFSVKVEDGEIITPEGGTISFVQETVRTLVAGGDTPLNIWDNQYSVEGDQSGVSSKGVNYNIDITEALNFKVVPRGVTEGVALVDVGTLEGVEIDYTNSVITIKGIEFPF